MALQIRVFENGSYQDEDAAYTIKEDFTADKALRRCCAMVEADLREAYIEGMSPEALLAAYRMWGRDPVIIGSEAPAFSAWEYAAARAAEMAK